MILDFIFWIVIIFVFLTSFFIPIIVWWEYHCNNRKKRIQNKILRNQNYQDVTILENFNKNVLIFMFRILLIVLFPFVLLIFYEIFIFKDIMFLAFFIGISIIFIWLINLHVIKIGQIVLISPTGISKPSFLLKNNPEFIKLSHIRYFQVIRKNGAEIVAISITTSDDQIIYYKEKFLSNIIWNKIYPFLNQNNIKKKPDISV